jgi:hypothetical protein
MRCLFFLNFFLELLPKQVVIGRQQFFVRFEKVQRPVGASGKWGENFTSPRVFDCYVCLPD